jgi:phosphatidate cytidylyltransferase
MDSLKNLIIRTITGAVFVASIIFSAIYSPHAFALLFMLMAMIGLWEYQRLAIDWVKKLNAVPGLFAGLLIYLTFPLYSLYEYHVAIFLSIVPILIAMAVYYALWEGRLRRTYIRGNLTGIILVVIPVGLLNLFLNPTAIPGFHTPWLVLGMFVILWTHDTFAYLTGSMFGRHPLYTRISPKKTLEGSIGGFGFAIVAAYVFSLISPMLAMWQWISFAIIITVFGTLGDLAESWLKRKAGVKDSGNLLPGHGGVLDRFDSILFVSPIIYLLILLYTS